MNHGRHVLVAILAVALAPACIPAAECLEGHACSGSHGNDGEGDPSADAGAAAAPQCTVFGRSHIGLGGEDLAAKADGPPGGDRARAKPYSALLTEYGRVLGSANAPPSISSAGPTFGIAQDRWYLEPIASAVFVSTAFDVAFEGCARMTGDLAGGSADAKYAAEPTEESARTECADWIRRFWSHDGSPDQIGACVSVAVETTQETFGRPNVDQTTRATTPRRRWAYACASVLSATGFLTF